jgi:hypothetical protein
MIWKTVSVACFLVCTCRVRGSIRNELRQLAMLPGISQIKVYSNAPAPNCPVGRYLKYACSALHSLSLWVLCSTGVGQSLFYLTTQHLKRVELKHPLLPVTVSRLQQWIVNNRLHLQGRLSSHCNLDHTSFSCVPTFDEPPEFR